MFFVAGDANRNAELAITVQKRKQPSKLTKLLRCYNLCYYT